MNVLKRRGWELPESMVTPEPIALNRRALVGGALAASTAAALPARAANTPVNTKYKPGRAITPEKDVETYNNYYEFSEDKDLWRAAQKMTVSPWSIKIEGLVKTPRTIAYEDLLKQVQLEERIYRHRCVEAWSMAVPWSGFPMAALVDFAKPLGSAKYIQMETFLDPKTAPGQKEFWYPWPYVEGVTVAEAGNELAFLVTGMYGKPVPKQDGAPLRLVLPWKYGFKSVKSIVRFSFTEKRPVSFWETVQGSEYGFWANVNPEVPHPRWSQATERVLGTNERVPTLKWNGYGEFVAHLYDGLEKERLFV